MFTKILLSYDGSDHAQNALRTAAEIASAFTAELHLSHTPQIDTPPIVVGAMIAPLEVPPSAEQIAQAGELMADRARTALADIGLTLTDCHVQRGDPAQNVLNTANALDADLIVMGRRGLGALRSLALGSVSQAVSHGATCAVLTVV